MYVKKAILERNTFLTFKQQNEPRKLRYFYKILDFYYKYVNLFNTFQNRALFMLKIYQTSIYKSLSYISQKFNNFFLNSGNKNFLFAFNLLTDSTRVMSPSCLSNCYSQFCIKLEQLGSKKDYVKKITFMFTSHQYLFLFFIH